MTLDKYQIFREVTDRICGDLNIETALKNCMNYLAEVIPIDIMYVLIVDEHWPALRPLAVVSNRLNIKIPQSAFIPITQEEMNWANNTLSLGKAVILNNVQNISLINTVSYALGVPDQTSSIHLRTAISGKYIGSIGVSAVGRERYLPEHGELIEELHKPFAIALINALHYQEILRLKEQIQEDQKELFKDINSMVGAEVIGFKGGLKSVMQKINQVAPLDSPVLLFGETGSGKEVIARHIHNYSNRSNGPFIKVDCGSIPENLVESELFGHEKGAFTGAEKKRRGRFERAMDGTIFLDEIGELSLSIQVKLLRILQDREFERVGGSQIINANARIIAATHRDLKGMVQNKDFREDLWYRLNVFPVQIPPLRERKQDIPELAHYFVRRKVKEMNLPEIPTLGRGAVDQLTAYDWPGNIRELQNIIERAIILSNGRPLSFPGLASSSPIDEYPHRKDDSGAVKTLNELNREHIIHVLNLTRGKVSGKDGAAQLLDIQPATLRARMRKLGVPFGRKVRTNFPLNGH